MQRMKTVKNFINSYKYKLTNIKEQSCEADGCIKVKKILYVKNKVRISWKFIVM
jgi:hypothetical protein